MEATQGIVGLFLFLYIAFGKAEGLAVREGDMVTFNCSGNASEAICSVSWIILKNGSRTDLTTCDNALDMECSETREDNTCYTASMCTTTNHCIQQTEIEDKIFISQLEIQNVTSELRHSVIECIMIDSLYFDSDEIVIIESYRIDLYYQSIRCDASKGDNNIINISCKVAKVFPNIKFRIFPERSASDPEVFTYLPELSNVKSASYRLAGTTEYFDAYCNEKYYPKQNGTFRFRVGIFAIGDSTHPAINFTTNPVTIGSKSTSFKRGSTSFQSGSDKESENVTTSKGSQSGISEIGNEHEAENCKTGTEIRTEISIEKLRNFYLLMGSVLTLAVTSFIIMSWAICTKKLPCQSTPIVDKGNEYESIQYVEVNKDNNGKHVNSCETGFSQSSESNTMFSYFSNQEEIGLPMRQEMSGYVKDIPVYRPHTNCATDGPCVCKNKTYIEPTSPTSTLSRSSQGDSTFDLSDHEDTCSATHVKSNI